MVTPLSVLVVIAGLDDRPGTLALRAAAAELDQRPDVQVSTFLLRGDSPPPGWPRARVVDSLRSWGPARSVEAVGALKLAGRLRGVRLRAWLAQARPDVVILDGGLGGRIDARVRRSHLTVVRLESIPDPDTELTVEPRYSGHPDFVIVGPGCASDADRLWRGAAPRSYPITRLPGARARIRASLGVPDGTLLVTGRGDDGWLDGPDLFIRTLWELQHHHGSLAHGAWFGVDAQPSDVDRLRGEVVRCGLGESVQFVADPGVDSLGSGDVVLLPYRGATTPDVPMAEIAAGSPVVSFPVWSCADPGLHLVEHLDLSAAAAAILAVAPGQPGEPRAGDAATGAGAWVDRFLADVESGRR